MRHSPHNRRSRSRTWLTVVSVIVSATILTGCGTQGEQQAKPETPQPEAIPPEEPQPEPPQPAKLPTERPEFLDFLAAAEPEDEPLPPGQPLPELEVEGWINGPPSETAVSAGNILVIECWAYW